MPEGPLADIMVLDLTHHIACPYCTKLLATYDAEVINIERPGRGDPSRQAGPLPDDIPHTEQSGLFLHLNTNKQSVTFNLKHPRGQDLVRELVTQVDATACCEPLSQAAAGAEVRAEVCTRSGRWRGRMGGSTGQPPTTP
jgi:crotonobetainyl-CoA:carnitine CoA-transferase CaiB-like acyl-CoA transferase